ncbi:MAG: DUF6531 domain-containing protein [Geobacteraceae bacterium]|nr:DUF6531 domain-containing protein [Geobacteraceae bacterium]
MKSKLVIVFVIFTLMMSKLVYAGVILQDDFESGSLSGWSTVNQGSGTATFSIANINGNKLLNINGAGSCTKGVVTATNYVIDSDVYIHNGNYWPYAVGILFGASALSGIYSMDGYIFQARNGWFEIEKWTNGASWEKLFSKSGGLSPGTWNHLKVEVNGSNVKCYANNALLFNENLPGATGGVGFRTWNAGVYFDNLKVTANCGLQITSFGGTSTIINPSSGGNVALSGSIADTSGQPITWTVTVAGKTYQGTGTTPQITWDGTDANGKVVDPGTYTATLTAQTTDNQCSDTKTITFNVEPPSDDSCALYVDFGSSASLASGNLSHSQELFSIKGTGLGANMTLYYNSKDSHSASLGAGWSPSFDISLNQNIDGSVVFRNSTGKRKLYTLSNGAYVSRTGDYSTLVKNADGTFTLTQKDGLKYNFGQNGKISSIIDRNGNTASFTYTNGNLTAITDPVGRATALSYDAANHVISITDPAGNGYTFTYNGNTLASVTYPDGGVWRYTYDANAFMLSKTDPLGKTTTYGYDDNHHVASSTDPEGKTRSIAYPQGSDVTKTTTFTEKDGGVWTYAYDTQKGTLTSKTDPQGGVTSYTYDANGNRLSSTTPDGTTTSYAYDASGNMTSMTDALNQATTYTYNTYGQVTSVTDPQGKVTSYNYDTKGNLASFTDPAGTTTRYEYDAKGNVTKVTDPAGQTTSFTYDQYGNLSSVTDPAGATSGFTFDAAGNVTSQTDPNGATTRFEYNVKNQLIKVTDPQGNVTSNTYDVNGNRISQTDANGNTTLFAYNYKGQLIKVTDPLGNSTTYTYGATGCPSCGGGVDKLTAVTDAKGNTTSYSYDALGRLAKETDPLGNATTYGYDAKGKLIAKTDANGNTVSQTYDPAGRLIGKGYPDGTQESFVYDGSGNLLNWQAPRENITSTYDAANRLTAKTYQNLGKGIKYEYDVSGRKSAMIDVEGGRTVYAYDVSGRVTKITDPAGNWASYSYDTSWRRSGVSYSNGTSTTYTFDTAGRLLNMTNSGPSGVISSYQYTYDKVGNRLTVKEAGGNSTTYTYDKLYRLTAYDETRPDANKGSFEYDPVGNRTKMLLARKFIAGDSRSFTYTYNQGNQLLDIMEKGRHSPIETVFGYDKNGSLASQAVTQGKTTAITSYLYDYLNRLSQVTTPDGKTVTIDNLTDGFSRLAKSTSDGTTKFIHDGMSVLAEYDATGNRSARYTLGTGTDEIIARKDSTGTYFYHYDGLGSVTTITDSTGKIVAKYDYEPFGRQKETSSSTINNPYTFTGREWDKETGLYHNGARYYDPMDGRFISKDPSGFTDSTNLYVYVLNNPINAIDPTGLELISVEEGRNIVNIARLWIGIAYRSGGSNEFGIDCSHLVWRVYDEAGFAYSYRTTGGFPPSGKFQAVSSPQEGDVVLYNGHMGIYTNGKLISARSGLGRVDYSPLSWYGPIRGYYRYDKCGN